MNKVRQIVSELRNFFTESGCGLGIQRIMNVLGTINITERQIAFEKKPNCKLTGTPKVRQKTFGVHVNIVSDKEFDYAGGAEIYQIYNNVFESVEVNQKKLLRYASRRNGKDRIEQILKSNNLGYIQTARSLTWIQEVADKY